MNSKDKGNTISGKLSLERNREILNYLLLLLFYIFLILISNSKLTGEDDLFWYLSTGRYIIETGNFPSTDVFGYVTQSQPWIPFEWCWDVINYYIYKLNGFAALSIFATILILIFYYLIYLNFKRLNISLNSYIIFLLLLTFGILHRLSIKPHLVTYLFLTLLLSILIEYRYNERRNLRPLYFIPLIFLLWINFHMGVIAGFLLFGIFVSSEIIEYIFKKPKDYSRKNLIIISLIFIFSILMTLINPHSIQTYKYALHIVSMKQLSHIYEWQSPFSGFYQGQLFIYIYYLFIFGLIPVSYFSYRKKDIFPFLIYISFLIYSTRSARLTTDFMILSVTFFALSIEYLINTLRKNNFLNRIRNFSVSKIILIILLIIAIINIPSNKLYRIIGVNRLFGTGIDVHNFPVKMFDFMKKNNITEIGKRPLNTYENGGFFIWNFPSKMNFIGSRGINDEIWDDYVSILNMDPGFENKIETYDFDYIIWSVPSVNFAQDPEILKASVISYFSEKSDKWKLLYWDDNSLLFVKKIPAFDNIISKYDYQIVTPYNYYFDRDYIRKKLIENKELVKMETERNFKEDKNGRIINAIKKSFEEALK